MLGIVGAVFALGYTPGPEKKPWDTLMGYPTVYGRMDTKGVMLANFGGASGCGGVGAYALASHHAVRPLGSCHTGADSGWRQVHKSVCLMGATSGKQARKVRSIEPPPT